MRVFVPLRSAVIAVLLAGFSPSPAAPQVAASDTVTVNGRQIFYQSEGDGAPLLLLHWFGGCGAVWEPHRAAFLDGYRLIIPDLPGHGRSGNPDGPFTHEAAARDMFGLLDALGIDRFQAIGLSSGGMTLLHMATQQPARVDAMILVGATSHFPEPAREIMRASIPDSMSEADFQEWNRCSSRGEAQTRDVLAQFRGMKDSYADMNFTEPYLGTITARTLIVHGDRDDFFPVSIPVRMYTSIPSSALWIVPEGGHIPIFGAWADAFQTEARRFLGGG